MAAEKNTSSSDDYAGQDDGVNEHGVPYIHGQNAGNSVQGLEELLASLGFSSVEEMMATAANL